MVLLSSPSDSLKVLSTSSLNASSLQTNSTALSLSPGLMDPLQQNNLLLGSSSSTNAALASTSTDGIQSLFTQDDQKLVKQYLYDKKYKENPALDDTFAGAYSLRTLYGSMTRSDNIGKQTDAVDYTHFRLEQASAFNLQLHGVQGNVLVDLLDSAGNKIARSLSWKDYIMSGRVTGIPTTSNLDTHDISLNLSSLGAGDYYIKVTPYPQLSSITTGGFRWLDQVGTDYLRG